MNNNNKKRVWTWYEKRTKQEWWKSQKVSRIFV